MPTGGIRARTSGIMVPAFVASTAAASLLLDSLSVSPIVAYSSRKLRAAYGGSAMEVRRSSDNLASDIGFSGSDLDTGALHSWVGANSGFVRTWYDQSTSGFNATQTTMANQPRVVNAGTDDTLNSHIAIHYPGGATTIALHFTPTAISQPLTFCICSKLDVVVADRHYTDTISGGATRCLVGVTGGPVWTLFASSALVSDGAPDTSAHGLIAVFNGASSILYLDNSNVASGDPGPDGIPATGQVIGGDAGDGDINGYLVEYMVFSGSLGASDRAIIKTSWQSYWGTP